MRCICKHSRGHLEGGGQGAQAVIHRHAREARGGGRGCMGGQVAPSAQRCSCLQGCPTHGGHALRPEAPLVVHVAGKEAVPLGGAAAAAGGASLQQQGHNRRHGKGWNKKNNRGKSSSWGGGEGGKRGQHPRGRGSGWHKARPGRLLLILLLCPHAPPPIQGMHPPVREGCIAHYKAHQGRAPLGGGLLVLVLVLCCPPRCQSRVRCCNAGCC